MTLTPADYIRRTISAPQRDTTVPVEPPIEPLQSLHVLMGWMLGPPAPMPRKRAIVRGELEVVAAASADACPDVTPKREPGIVNPGS